MRRVVVFIGLVFFLFSCGQVDVETKDVVEKETKNVKKDSIIELIDSIIEVSEGSIEINEELVISTGATVLSIGEELIMPSDYLTTTMHVVTNEGDTMVFLNMLEEDAVIGDRISIHYKLEKVEDALLCLDCEEYLGKVDLIDATLISGEVEFKYLKLVKCTPDDYIVVNAAFQFEDSEGALLDFKTLDYKMIDDTTKMLEGFYSYGIVSQYYPELESFEKVSE